MPSVSFTDYILMALLNSFLLLINVIEYFITKVDKQNERGKSLIKGAEFSFLGIFLTILAGLLSQARLSEKIPLIPSEVTSWFILIPVVTMLSWAIHYRFNSKLIASSIIREHINTFYEKKVLELFNNQPYLTKNAILSKFILTGPIINDFYENVLIKASRFPFLPAKDDFIKLFEDYLLTEEKLALLLEETLKKEIGAVGEEYYLKP